MFWCLWFLSLLLLHTSGGEIRNAPVGKTVFLGRSQPVKFYCTTSGSIGPRWIVNGSDLNHGVHRVREITRCAFEQIGGSQYNSTLCVEASEENNNTGIQCAASSARSQPVLLRVQGLLAAPPGLTATVLNSSTVRLTWSPPFTLNVSGAQPSITGYSIVVEDIYTDQEVVLARNSSLSEYYHHSSDCQFYQVTVAGLNGVGMGQWSQPVTYSLGDISTRSLLGPNTSTIPLNRSSQFSCEIHCSDSLLVTWLINGSFLNYHRREEPVPLRLTATNDHAESCPTNGIFTATLTALPRLLDLFTVQCAAVHVCDDGEPCRHRVCYGKEVHVEVQNETTGENAGTPVLRSTTHARTDVIESTIMEAKFTEIELTVATSTGITIFFSVLIIIILCISIITCREIKRRQKVAAEAVPELPARISNAEAIYEQCGDPAKESTAIYERVPQSLSPKPADIQPYVCVTFGPRQPHSPSQSDMEPCIAYSSRQSKPALQLNTEPCIAYGSRQSEPLLWPDTEVPLQPDTQVPLQPDADPLQPDTEPCVAYGHFSSGHMTPLTPPLPARQATVTFEQ